MLKIVVIMNDVIEKNKIKSYLNRASRIKNFDFELVKDFEDNRQAVNFLYQNEDIDIVIIENTTAEIFAGLDFVMLAEKEFPNMSIILITEMTEELKLENSNFQNLTAILNKKENFSTFVNTLSLTIMNQKRKNEEFRKEKVKLNDYRTIIDHTHDAIFLLEVDCDGNFYYKRINGTHQRLTALSNEEIRGKKAEEIFSKEVAEELEQNYRRCLEQKTNIKYTETIKFPAGEKSWQTSLYPVVRNGRIVEIVGSSYDITEMEAKQKKLNFISSHDNLTGLYNKEYFYEIFAELNAEDIDLALILVDINNFYIINKFYGYGQGNQILKEIGSILAKNSGDEKIAAHLSADQFGMILKNEEVKEREKITQKIKKEINKIKIADIELDITVISIAKKNKTLKAQQFFNDGVGKIKVEKFKKSSSKNSKFYQSLLNFLEKNDYKEIRHSSKLLELAAKTASDFNLSPEDKEKFLSLAEHHDIGKLGINKNILKKGSKLTDLEWQEYQKHVMLSANFTANYYNLNYIHDLIYHHHEHYDGSGWPDNLKGEQIPYLNRLFIVVNFYDHLINNLYYPFLKNKYYFAALDKQEVIKELKKYRAIIFDPKIVDKFVEHI